LGKSDRREMRSQNRRIHWHLFKLDASPAADPRAGWRTTIRDARVEIEDVLRGSPSLRREVEDFVSEEAGRAAKSAAAAFEQHGDAVRVRLEKGGFTAEQDLIHEIEPAGVILDHIISEAETALARRFD
jgi:hypothetical protein